MELQKRKHNRLQDYDYSQNGAYFITVCTRNKENILGSIPVGVGVLDDPNIKLSKSGLIVELIINMLSTHYKDVFIDKYVIMPNHLHMIVCVCKPGGTSRTPSPTNAKIPAFMSTLKRFINKKTGLNVFQRSYHDHIIRDEREYEKIWQYIDGNPSKWQDDCYYKKELVM